MGLRFRKSFRLMPGLRVNLSKSGPSLTVGGRGITTNYSKRGARSTIGVPGTGVSYSTKHSNRPGAVMQFFKWGALLIFLVWVVAATL